MAKRKKGGRYTPPSEWRAETREVRSYPQARVVPDYRSRAEALETLEKLRARRESVEAAIPGWVEQARGAGATLTEIGRALGVSKQAVSKRFSKVQ
jgi:AcrR family transcriptional regulator